jgi:hypothetical protein
LLARIFDPRIGNCISWYETVDILFLLRQIQCHHHRVKRSDIFDPRFLHQEGRQLIVSDNHYWMIRRVPRKDHGTNAGVVGLMSDAIEPAQIEHVMWNRCDDTIQPPCIKHVKQSIQIAKAFWQRFPIKGIA